MEFAQDVVHHVCQRRGLLEKRSETCGFECKCRNPRCSLPCYFNYCSKLGTTISHFLKKHLPVGMKVYRGCLKMLPDATVSDHRRVRAKFNRLMPSSIKYHCTIHITDGDSCHYDYTAYSSSAWAADTIRAAWSKAGGHYSSCVPLDCGRDVSQWTSYASKSRRADKTRFKFLPEHNKLPLTWYKRGFFCGKTVDGLWKEWCKEYFGTVTINKTTSLHRLLSALPSSPINATPLTSIASKLGWSWNKVVYWFDRLPQGSYSLLTRRMPDGNLRSNLICRGRVDAFFFTSVVQQEEIIPMEVFERELT